MVSYISYGGKSSSLNKSSGREFCSGRSEWDGKVGNDVGVELTELWRGFRDEASSVPFGGSGCWRIKRIVLHGGGIWRRYAVNSLPGCEAQKCGC